MKFNPAKSSLRTLSVAAALLCGAGLANAALTLKYNFENVIGTDVPNLAPGATINGTLVNGNGGGTVAIQDGPSVLVGGTNYPLGKVCNFAAGAYNDGWSTVDAPYVNTNAAQSVWGIAGNGPYTVMCWAKFNNQTGDNMIFGTQTPAGGGEALHLGARDSRHWSGHWGDDVEGTNIATDTANWHHLTWTNDASNNQQIYLDGVLMTGTAGAGIAGGGAGGMSSASPLAIGTSNNGGSFNGLVDEVKVFNSLLTPAEINAERIPTLVNPDISISSLTGNAAGAGFVASLVLRDGTSPGREVVTASITSVTFNGAAAASFSAVKTDNLTTITATLDGPYNPGAFVYNVRVQGTDAGAVAYDLNQNLAGPILPQVAVIAANSPFSATPSLPWAVREYATTAANGTAAMGVILTNTPPFTDHETPVINFNDPEAPGTLGDFNNDLPFPGGTAADDNHIILGKAKLEIPAAGTYSFNFRTDDGCGLKIEGANCTGAYGVVKDPSDSSFVFNESATSARAAFSFPAAGTYDVAFISFDSGGGGSAELSWAAGAVTANDERQLAWSLMGNTAHPSVLPTTSAFPANLPGPIGAGGNWGIRTYQTAGYENVDNLAQTMDFLTKPSVAAWAPGYPMIDVSRTSWRSVGVDGLSIDSLTTPQFAIPAGAGAAQLTLVHRHGFEGGLWDGGIIEYSINGGAFTYLDPGAFTQNGYTGAIVGTSLLGTTAFTENSAGYSSGALITSLANIPGVSPGDNLQLRLTAGYDECCLGGVPAWEVTRLQVQWGGTSVFDSELSPTDDGGLVGSGSWVFDPGGTVTTRTGVVDTLSPALVYRDPETNGEGGVVTNAQPFPGNTGGDDDRIVTIAKCRIDVAAAGDYTFNDQSDDGFFLRITGVGLPNPVFRTVTGGGTRTMSAPNEIYFPTGTGNADTRGVTYLEAGQYDVTYVNWEGGGGFFYQLTMAAGVHLTNASTNDWVPVGHTASNALLVQPSMESPWDVQASFANVPGMDNLATAEAALFGLGATQYNTINFTDPETNGAGPGSIGGDDPWPNNVAGVDDNNYAIGGNGYLHIEQEGWYLLGFRGDDGSRLVVQGASFSRILQNSTGAAVISSFAPGSNNALVADVDTGDSFTTGLIYLVPDDYPISVLFYEQGGGSFFEVTGSAYSAAPISPNKTTSLVLLRYDPSYPAGIPTFTPDNVSGFPLVAQPPSADLSGGFSSYGFVTGNSYSFTFPTTEGRAYALEYSFDLVTWYRAAAGFAGAGSRTTFSGLLSDLNPPVNSGTSRLQWRARNAN